MPLLRGSPLQATLQSVYRVAGAEALVFRSGSRLDVFASLEGSGHGRVIDLALLDESFADEDDRREQAMLPAMSTRPGAQLFVISTAGTETSTYLRRKVDTGRDAVANGVTEGTAYFEWSADPESDPDDPATWRSCMPALDITITEATIRHQRATMTPGTFARMALNLWTVSEARDTGSAVAGDTERGRETPRQSRDGVGRESRAERSVHRCR